MEKAVAEMFNWIMTGILTVVILTISMLLYFTNQRTQFVTQTQEIIQRTGGLTKNAINDIDKLSDDNYHGMFTIVDPDDIKTVKDDESKYVDYGKTIKYAITTKLPLIGFTVDHIKGSDVDKWKVEKTVSEVRKGTMPYQKEIPASKSHNEIREKIYNNESY